MKINYIENKNERNCKKRRRRRSSHFYLFSLLYFFCAQAKKIKLRFFFKIFQIKVNRKYKIDEGRHIYDKIQYFIKPSLF